MRYLIIVLLLMTSLACSANSSVKNDEAASASGEAKQPNADENINLDNRGEFSVRCTANPNERVDPIVSPGVKPSKHNHTPAGGTMAATVSFESLRAGPTSCHFARGSGTKDAPPHSLMWVPVLKQNGDPVPVQTFIAYYRLAKGHTPGQVKPFPDGLQLFAGPQSESPDGRIIVDWGCGGTGGGDYETPFPHKCNPKSANNFLKTRITFPSCSDGRIRSDDHRSHLAYPDFETGCPESHPIQIPMLQLVVQYQTASAKNLTLSSYGMMDIGGVKDTGTKTQHADYINGWGPTLLRQLTNKCINAQVQCGATGLP